MKGLEYLPFYGEKKYHDRIRLHVKINGKPDKGTPEREICDDEMSRARLYHSLANKTTILIGSLALITGLEAIVN